MSKKLNILICGSQQFQDKSFVFGMLDTIVASGLPLTNIVTGKFSGACELAKQWVKYHNEKPTSKKKIGVIDFDFDMHLGQSNLSLYEQIDIPDAVVNTDKFFLKGKEQILKKDIKLVLAFPNKTGNLGASTRNIVRFADMAKVKHLDCSQALHLIQAYRSSVEQKLNRNTTTEPTQQNTSKPKP